MGEERVGERGREGRERERGERVGERGRRGERGREERRGERRWIYTHTNLQYTWSLGSAPMLP